jgi:coenzyme F420-reducing hydrogenase beta subunit
MIEIVDRKECTGCSACFSVCPEKCITMNEDEDGFYYPEVIHDECTKCSLCINICPVINVSIVKNAPKAYACINNDELLRIQSSSGGIFTAIANEILDRNGVVFGAAFDANFNVTHQFVDSREELQKLRGSKYVQSQINTSYIKTKSFLEQGRLVLFSGTLCQIAGLKAYLQKNYENLFCVDIICHGVPSPKVWTKYVAFRSERASSSPKRISFRRKDYGWKRYSVSFLFKNDTEYLNNLRDDVYMKAFLKNISLRPSCHSCKFKTINRQSDITLADFWGVNNIFPDMDDDKGTSLVFVNNQKGNSVFNAIIDKMQYREADIKEAIKFNSAAVKSVMPHSARAEFFRNVDKLPFDKLVYKYCSDPISTRIKNYVKIFLQTVGLLNITKKLLGK